MTNEAKTFNKMLKDIVADERATSLFPDTTMYFEWQWTDEYLADVDYIFETYWYPLGITNFEGDEFYNFIEKIDEVIIPEGMTNIEDGMFSDFTGLTKITIPKSVTRIGDVAFARCANLKSITIPDSVKECGMWAFHENTKVKYIA